MPRQTLSEAVRELQRDVAELRTALAVVRRDIDASDPGELRHRLGILEDRLARSSESSKCWGNRLFDLFKLLLAAGLGAAATYFLARK